jgi:hypothetical protein
MEPLTARALAAAERRWAESGAASYRLVVRIRAPRARPAVYDLVVTEGTLAEVACDGEAMGREELDHHDYSVTGLFDLLRADLPLAAVRSIGNTPPIDLRAQFEPQTGRLVRYRRTVGSARRRVLLVEVLAYEPGAAGDETCAAPAVEP